MLSLEQYCGQTVKDLISKSGLALEANTSKIIVLSKAAPAYYKLNLLSEQSLQLVTDDRFARLYKAKVRDLQRLLLDHNVTTPKQGKAKMAILCYELNLDIQGNLNDSSDSQDNSDEGLISESLMNQPNPTSFTDNPSKFYLNGNNLYFNCGETNVLLTDTLLRQLFDCLLARK